MIEWIKNWFGFLVFWAFVCAGLIFRKIFEVWDLAENGWFGVLVSYLILYVLGAILFPLLGFADRFESEYVRFLFQMLSALIVAAFACALLVIYAI